MVDECVKQKPIYEKDVEGIMIPQAIPRHKYTKGEEHEGVTSVFFGNITYARANAILFFLQTQDQIKIMAETRMVDWKSDKLAEFPVSKTTKS